MPTVTATLATVAGRGAPRTSLSKYTRSFDATRAIWAVRVMRYNPNTGLDEPFYYSSKNLFTAWGSAASTYFSAVLQQPSLVSRTGFGDHTTQGRGQVSVGAVVLNNLFGALDYLQSYPVDGRSITCYLGQENAEFPSGFQVVFDGTMEQELIGQSTATIKIRDWQRAVKVPIQTTVYAGNNVAPDGLEGEADLKGKPKPVLMGTVRNASPVCVNAQKLIYQIHDAAVAGIDSVYDSGIRLGELPSTSVNAQFGASVPAGYSSLAYGNGVVVSVGTSGALSTSADAATWTAQTSGFGASHILCVAFGGGIFMIGGQSGKLSTSPDGVTWTSRSLPGGWSTNAVAALAYGNGTWMAIGENGNVATSTDMGVNWTSRTSGLGAITLLACAYGNGAFVILGTSTTIAVSTDLGATWSNPAPHSSWTSGNFITFGNGAFLATDQLSAVYRSVDGRGWARLTANQTTTAGGRLYYANGRYLYTGAGYIAESFDGLLWVRRSVGVTADQWYAVTSLDEGGPFVVAGVNAGAASHYYEAARLTYASLAALEDDTLAPTAGNWKLYTGSEGSFFRLGSTPAGRITCDPVHDASFTAADGWAAALVRAGYVGGTDYSASDVSTRSAANPAQTGIFIPDGDRVMCADVADLFAQTDGSMWFGDISGVMRLMRLADPGENLVTNPDTLTVAGGWIVAGCTPVSNYSSLGDISFTRIVGASAGQIARVVTLGSDGVKRFACVLEWDGVAGTTVHALFDNTSSTWLARATVTWASDGTATAVATEGTLLRLGRLGTSRYGLSMQTVSAIAAHTNVVYGLQAATATSIRVGRVQVYDSLPDATLTSMDGTSGEIVDLNPMQSADANAGLPVTRSVVRYSRNYTPMFGTDLAGGVSDANRALFGKEYLDAGTDLDAAVLAAHPLAVQRVDDSLYVDESDAQDEADRRQDLFGVERYWFDVVVLFTDVTAAIEIGDNVEVVSGRFLMGAGTRFRVLGIRPDAQAGRITLQLWR